MSNETYIYHYASQYYDPVKAHEYYMRTRQLKGRTTKGMTKEQKEKWKYVKSQITSEKKTKVTALSEQKKRQIAEQQAKAKQTRERISARLAELAKKLSEKATKDKNQVDARTQAAIDRLGKIPENLSREQKAKLIEKRQKYIDNLRGKSKSDKADISEDAQEGQASAKNSAATERTKVGNDLRAAVTKARETFAKSKEELKAKYEKVYQDEYDKIRSGK